MFGYRDLPFFFRFARPVRGWGATALALTIVSTAAYTFLPLSGKFLIDFVIGKREPRLPAWLTELFPALLPFLRGFVGDVGRLILAMVLVGAVAGVADLVRKYAALRYQQGLKASLQSALFDHLLRFPHSFFRDRHVGYLMSRASDDVHALEYLFSRRLSQAVTRLFGLVMGLAVLFSLSARLTLAALLAGPVSVAINVFFSAPQRRSSRREREAVARTSQGIQEVLAGVEVVKSHAAEERESRRIRERVHRMYASQFRSSLLSLSAETLGQAVQFATTLLILWLGYREIVRGAMTVGDYVAFVTYTVYLGGAVTFFSFLHLSMQPLMAALERIAEIFAIVPEDEEPAAGPLARPEAIDGEIRFEGVGYSYGDPERPVLRSVDLVVRRGETVALVGRSGAGKTTLANLMLKFHLPERGRILLDGRDYRTLDTRWLRERIGVVHQETFLFEDTAENNIRYGRPDATREEVELAARRARIHDEILRLPRGYETPIGERGARLSAGQRQRIGIARAFLRDSPLLILDEPTTALDAAAEAHLRESMAELAQGRTVLLITHKRTTMQFADRVLVLDDGVISSGEPQRS
ncbi:MAG: ABC transporter ATP-binding protein [Deltaproteobacteria bacterium]|nr:ABC transporter ATP-binding protein [Deltaproteobacteria bacterium]